MFCNIAAYKFITLKEEELPSICKYLKQIGMHHSLKGTILLGTEGINLFLAGENKKINKFQAELISTYSIFNGLSYKYSYSDFIPFKKLFVKIRKEIVTFNQKHIHPEDSTAPYVTPPELKNWLQQRRYEFVLLDTRNAFEYNLGTFDTAVHLNIKNFREFPEALKQINGFDKNKPVVTFCTGGIRCEKAAAYLLENSFKEVYQLQGGILNYFEQCGGEFYQGNCFVFDDRISLNSKLEPVSIPIEDKIKT